VDAFLLQLVTHWSFIPLKNCCCLSECLSVLLDSTRLSYVPAMNQFIQLKLWSPMGPLVCVASSSVKWVMITCSRHKQRLPAEMCSVSACVSSCLPTKPTALYHQCNLQGKVGVCIRDQQRDLMQDDWQALYHLFIRHGLETLFLWVYYSIIVVTSQHYHKATTDYCSWHSAHYWIRFVFYCALQHEVLRAVSQSCIQNLVQVQTSENHQTFSQDL